MFQGDRGERRDEVGSFKEVIHKIDPVKNDPKLNYSLF